MQEFSKILQQHHKSQKRNNQSSMNNEHFFIVDWEAGWKNTQKHCSKTDK